MTASQLADYAHEALQTVTSFKADLMRAVAKQTTPDLEHALACAIRAETRIEEAMRTLQQAMAKESAQ